MTPASAASRAHLTRLALVVGAALAACAESPAPPMRSSPSLSRSPLEATDPVDVTLAARVAADFQGWLARYQAADPAARTALAPLGRSLAAARRPLYRALLLQDPELALAHAVPPRVQGVLPAEVTAELERFRDGMGALWVMVALDDSLPAERARYFVEFEGREERLPAGVFGRRLTQPSASRLRLHGVELDGVIALTTEPLRRLDGEESFAELPEVGGCPAQPELSSTRERYHGGSAIYTFCDPDKAAQLTQALVNEEETLASSWTMGAKTVLFMRVDYSDNPGDPLSQAAATSLIDSTANTFLVANSFGALSVTATVTPLLRLPKTQATYQATQDTFGLLRDARAAALAAGYNTANFDFDIVAFKSTFSGFKGLAYVGGKGLWMNGEYSLRTACHELGHNLGLMHANVWSASGETIIGPGSSVEYGNSHDTMSSSAGGHFGVWFKSLLGWVPPAEVATVATSGTYRVSELQSAITSGFHGIKVPRGDGAKDYWLEYRRGTSGALINWGYAFSRQSDLLDMVPRTGSIGDAALVIGRTFSDRVAGRHFTPIGKGGTTPESLDVVVNLGDFASNRVPTVTVSASQTAVAVNAAVTLTATASDPDGDPLAFWWDFGDGTQSIDNRPQQTKSFSAAGTFWVRVAASDMKGQQSSAAVLVTVGSPSTFALSGTVTAGGQPVEGVRVSDGTRSAFTVSNGTYVLANVAAGSVTVSAIRPGFTFTRAFASPVTVAGDVTGLDFTAVATPATTAITGTILSGATPLAGAVVSNGLVSATTNASGAYSLTVPNGRYTLTATLAGWALAPSGWTNPVFAEGGARTANFRPTGVTVSGTITGVSAAPVVTDGVRSATAVLSSGTTYSYALAGVPPGAWNLSARLTGSTVSPSNFTNPVTVGTTTVSNRNFAAVAGTTFAILGTITTGGTPLPGVVVTDGTRSSTTDPLGRFSITGVPGGTYTLTPSAAGYTFTPATRLVTVAGADLPGQDFATTVVNPPPTVATAAAVSPSPVTGTTATLTVLGADDSGEAGLTYTWLSSAPAAVTYSANGTHAASTTVATFSAAGTYPFVATIRDPGGLSVTSQVTATVAQTLTSLAISPANAALTAGATQQFSCQARDQFGASMSRSVSWQVSGGGTIDASGRLVAGTTLGGPFTVTCSSGAVTGSATFTVVGSGSPTITRPAAATPSPVTGTSAALSVLAADDGGEATLTYTWSAPVAPAPATFSANGTNGAKNTTVTFTAAGSYQLLVSVADASGNLVTSSAQVVVQATVSALDVQPRVAMVQPGARQAFTATATDQFGEAVAPGPVAWTTSGGGTIDAAGLFTAAAGPGGPYTITATAGGLSVTAQVSVVAGSDTTPPMVSVVEPAAFSRLNGRVLVRAEASDEVGVVRVDFLVDGLPCASAAAEPWQTLLDTATLSNGPHLLAARAVDAAGNAATSAGVPVVVGPGTDEDTTAPTVVIVSPADGAEVGSPLTVEVAASDDVGVTSVELEVDEQRVSSLSSGPWVATLELSPGRHRVVAIAHDAASHSSRSLPVEVTVTGAPPSHQSLEPVTGRLGCSAASGFPASGLLVLFVGLRAARGRPGRGNPSRPPR